MRRTLAIAVLMLAFCCPALAGEIPYPPAPQKKDNRVLGPTAASDMRNGSADSLTQTVLDLLALLPSLL